MPLHSTSPASGRDWSDDGGDLTRNVEAPIVSPLNRIGEIGMLSGLTMPSHAETRGNDLAPIGAKRRQPGVMPAVRGDEPPGIVTPAKQHSD